MDDKKQPSNKELEELGKALKNVYDYGYVSKKRLLYLSFLRGLATGFGVFLGGSVLIIILLWVLSFFSDVPVLEQIYRLLNQSYS